ncbi:threonine ammonia-lyase [Demequina pelophila]|uniref:threonine ammonia-lyase n=1 Tax=Demequina pelophila TaxID=1638984 RepID=UPI0007837DDB|nr:pyridoxal-phosphate dependent enzyme [Demequina pelophila]
MTAPTFEGILNAANLLSAKLPRTPAWSYPLLDERAGRRVIVKHENVQPTGAFKVRGGLTLLAGLSAEQRAAGLVTVSTGNHAQSLAYASRAASVAATIVMPATTPEFKADAVRALGASVALVGASMNDAATYAASLAEQSGAYFVNPGNEAGIVHGHGTVYLELLTQYPEIDTLYVPVGSGSGAAGAVLVRDAISPSTRVVGVQAAGAPAAYRSWKSGELVTADADTLAAGLATGVGFATPQAILRDGLDDFLLVSEAELRDAIATMAHDAHTLCEGAGAAGLAGILQDRDRGVVRGARAGASGAGAPSTPGVAAFACTGGNAGSAELLALAKLDLAA